MNSNREFNAGIREELGSVIAKGFPHAKNLRLASLEIVRQKEQSSRRNSIFAKSFKQPERPRSKMEEMTPLRLRFMTLSEMEV